MFWKKKCYVKIRFFFLLNIQIFAWTDTNTLKINDGENNHE